MQISTKPWMRKHKTPTQGNSAAAYLILMLRKKNVCRDYKVPHESKRKYINFAGKFILFLKNATVSPVHKAFMILTRLYQKQTYQ